MNKLCIFLIIAVLALSSLWLSQIKHTGQVAAKAQMAAFTESQATLQSELENLNWQLQSAKLDALTEANLTPSNLIERLRNLGDTSKYVTPVQPDGEEGQFREASFCFQGLVLCGTNSIPDINDYLSSGVNTILGPTNNILRRYPASLISISITYEDGGANRYGMVVPETTRLGLAYVLNDIRGAKALLSLWTMFQNAADEDEILQVGRMLLDFDSLLYKAPVLAATRNILKNADEEMREKIINFLAATRGPVAEAIFAELPLREPDGKLDGNIATYKVLLLGTNAIPAIYEEYKKTDPTPSDDSYAHLNQDRATLMYAAEQCVGLSEQANEMAKDWFTNFQKEDFSGRAADFLSYMAGVRFASGVERDLTAEQAKGRLTFFADLKETYGSDELFSRCMEAVTPKLEYLADRTAYGERPQIDPEVYEGLCDDISKATKGLGMINISGKEYTRD